MHKDGIDADCDRTAIPYNTERRIVVPTYSLMYKDQACQSRNHLAVPAAGRQVLNAITSSSMIRHTSGVSLR
jgi:hypothetical protein